ncbi:MAG: transposase, partial [Rhodocyclaceae bacterium]|nr:transposase [Rhodocyclaceae bacterium]
MPVHRARAERRARWNEAEGNEHGQFTAPVHHRKDGETGAAHPELLTPVLGIVHRVITGFLIEQVDLRRGAADAGSVTLIQRFGSAGNLNVHLHCLVLAPNAKLRGAVIPQPEQRDNAPAHEHAHGQAARMSWARLLKRVFHIDVERCACGG